MTIEEIRQKMSDKKISIIYPKDGKKEGAEKIAGSTESAIGILISEDDEGNRKYGVMIDDSNV